MQLLKWAGGKGWLVDSYPHLFPETKRFREPFLGGGAVAGHYLGRSTCILSDSNRDLIVTYAAVRDNPESVISELSRLTFNPDTYAHVRHRFNGDRSASYADRAAWLIYLNRTCFNGLYRVNRRGKFNVPIGDYKNPKFCDPDRIRKLSALLQDAILSTLDFESALTLAGPDDFVFLDPPYVPVSKTANFTGYQAGGFGPADQARLAARLKSLCCHWLLTNADTPEARALYAGWHIEGVPARRSINSKGAKRRAVGELLVSNRPIDILTARSA
jgi:DNA adenine methylase